MAPTEGRVARPERRWGCRRGTPVLFASTCTVNAAYFSFAPPHRGSALGPRWRSPLPFTPWLLVFTSQTAGLIISLLIETGINCLKSVTVEHYFERLLVFKMKFVHYRVFTSRFNAALIATVSLTSSPEVGLMYVVTVSQMVGLRFNVPYTCHLYE